MSVNDAQDIEIYEVASGPFELNELMTDRRGGQEFTYATGERVFDRANDAYGVFGWSSRVLEHGINTDADEVWALVQVSIHKRIRLETHDGFREEVHTVTREQFGSQKLKRSRASGTILDIGFDLKGAVTDATKKALTLVGVGLYLTNKQEQAELKLLQADRARREAMENRQGGNRQQALSAPEQPNEPPQDGNPPQTATPARRSPQSRRSTGPLVINGITMPDGFVQPFRFVPDEPKTEDQCAAEACEMEIYAEATYKVGKEDKPGEYVIKRALEEAGCILCPTHMATWFKAKTAAGKAA